MRYLLRGLVLDLRIITTLLLARTTIWPNPRRQLHYARRHAVSRRTLTTHRADFIRVRLGLEAWTDRYVAHVAGPAYADRHAVLAHFA